MKSGRMVLDIDNQLLWFRLTHSLTEHPSPNPTTSIPNTNVRSVVCFAYLPPETLILQPPSVNPMPLTRILHPSPRSDPVC